MADPLEDQGLSGPRSQQPVISTLDNLDLSILEYIRRYKESEWLQIRDKCELQSNATLKFLTQSKAENEAAQELFILLYRTMKGMVAIEEFDISGVPNVGELKTEIETKFKALAYLTGNNKLQVVCEKQNMKNVQSVIGVPQNVRIERDVSGSLRRVQPQFLNATTDAVGDFIPHGYLVYGMVKVYLHVCDITRMHVNVVVILPTRCCSIHRKLLDSISNIWYLATI